MPKIVAFALEVFLLYGGNLTPLGNAKLAIISLPSKLQRDFLLKSLLIKQKADIN